MTDNRSDRARQISAGSFDFESHINETILPNASQLDSDASLVGHQICEIMTGLALDSTDAIVSPNLPQLELLFSASTALAFTLSQHVSAVDRLALAEDWQNRNPNLWQDIKRGRYLCGLGTTNLGKPGGAGVQAIEADNGFVLNGIAPWVCGYGIFQGLVLGFETANSYVFALIDFPHPLRSGSLTNIEVRAHNLACLNGTATCAIHFQNALISLDRIVSSRDKNIAGRPRTARGYLIPELGMAVGAIREVKKTIETSSHPRLVPVEKSLGLLEDRLTKIRQLRDAGECAEKLIVLRDELIHDANRLLVLAQGARALEKGSLASRAQLEFMLMDTIIQAPEVFAEKAHLIGSAKNAISNGQRKY